ncbi:hypothetical protein Angca_008039 [Angiostrongylus cantonensis]|nr:hypothetical protein Angca_008039 [Angiostrongylus cantonensis]
MMSSRMVNCQYCNRLYTQYSLPLHQPKCQENPWVARLSPTGRSARPDWMTTSRRPTTRSMSRPTVEFRMCFVCGKHFDEQHIAHHEQKCFEDWYKTCDRLGSRFKFRTPIPLLVPSVDGTCDVHRLNEHAAAQVAMAQILRCRNCGAEVSLSVAERHRCTRHQPAIELFF